MQWHPFRDAWLAAKHGWAWPGGLGLVVLRPVGDEERLDAAAGPGNPRRHGDLTHRDRAQDLAGEPSDHHLVPGLAAQHGPAEEGAGRAGMLRAWVPGAGGVYRRLPPVVPERNVEALCHATNATDRSPDGARASGGWAPSSLMWQIAGL